MKTNFFTKVNCEVLEMQEKRIKSEYPNLYPEGILGYFAKVKLTKKSLFFSDESEKREVYKGDGGWVFLNGEDVPFIVQNALDNNILKLKMEK